jgi:hypothetical protein
MASYVLMFVKYYCSDGWLVGYFVLDSQVMFSKDGNYLYTGGRKVLSQPYMLRLWLYVTALSRV